YAEAHGAIVSATVWNRAVPGAWLAWDDGCTGAAPHVAGQAAHLAAGGRAAVHGGLSVLLGKVAAWITGQVRLPRALARVRAGGERISLLGRDGVHNHITRRRCRRMPNAESCYSTGCNSMSRTGPSMCLSLHSSILSVPAYDASSKMRCGK